MLDEEEEKEEDLGRGARKTKEVTYQEQLSERDWLKVHYYVRSIKALSSSLYHKRNQDISEKIYLEM